MRKPTSFRKAGAISPHMLYGDLSVTASASTIVNLWSIVSRIDMSCTKSPGFSGPRHSLACS